MNAKRAWPLLAAAVVGLAWLLFAGASTTEDRTLLLVKIAAPAQTLFLLVYGSGIWAKWWRSLIGRALFTKALGLTLLLDLSLVGQWFGPYPHQDDVGLCVVAVVTAGCYLQLAALLNDIALHRGVRPRRSPEDDKELAHD